MGFKGKRMQLALLLLIALARIEAAADDDHALLGCTSTCGNVSIPYPFGIGTSSFNGDKCFLEKKMGLVCINSTLYRGNSSNHDSMSISNISINGRMEMLASVSQVCRNGSSGEIQEIGNKFQFQYFPFSSDENKFVTVGCDSYGYLDTYDDGSNNRQFMASIGCLTRCYNQSYVKRMQRDGNCTGIGCCQVDIPPGMKNFDIHAYSFNNFSDIYDFSKCSYSFVVKKGYYKFSMDDLNDLSFGKHAPIVFDWTIGNDTCENSKPNACKNNSYCENSGAAYVCKCKPGWEGNPYHPNGCRDILECSIGKHNCTSEQYCRETPGSFKCVAKRQNDPFWKISIGVGVGLITLLMGTSWLHLIHRKRKVLELKEKFFKQNGGMILKQLLSGEDSSKSTTIFTAEQLKKATNDFDEKLIIGKGGYGTVFKGSLSNNKIVAIKKSKIVDQSQVEQFINEVVVLSQINHRNVVKLLGCCLETEVPLLVYEFINNGTLFDYLHGEGKAANVSWKTRLRIASEAAIALSYLHSEASIPIIHRDVKTANILLDDSFTAKVSDFGASRFVPLDQTELATIVQGTIGYLDPEYMQTSQLTDKSDVYSFGVVLVELLTGEKPFSFIRPEEKRNLSIHFLSCLKQDCLFDSLQIGILDDESKHEILEVAILAAKCLKLTGEERPSMKEVAMELERIRLMEKHPWTKASSYNLEETQYLLHEASSNIYEPDDSSSNQDSGYGSIRDHVLVNVDHGR